MFLRCLIENASASLYYSFLNIINSRSDVMVFNLTDLDNVFILWIVSFLKSTWRHCSLSEMKSCMRPQYNFDNTNNRNTHQKGAFH